MWERSRFAAHDSLHLSLFPSLLLPPPLSLSLFSNVSNRAGPGHGAGPGSVVRMGSRVVYLAGIVPFATANTVVRLRRKHEEVRGRYRREG